MPFDASKLLADGANGLNKCGPESSPDGSEQFGTYPEHLYLVLSNIL